MSAQTRLWSFRHALMAGSALTLIAGAVQAQETNGGVETIIVTAEKRAERLQDTPVPVGVIEAAKLTDNNLTLLRDYYTRVPGLSIQADIVSQQEFSIRGITTANSGIPTVGVTVDGIPYGGSTNPTASNYIPDIDPSDLASIEVLRGPQGALYGGNAMGGLVNFVTVDPSTSGFSGRFLAGIETISNGNGPGYSLRGAVNVPVTDDLAMRVSVYNREDPGFIDNPSLSLKGLNETKADGARWSALWQPSDWFSLKVSALYQYYKTKGLPEADVGPGLGDLQQNYLKEEGRGYDRSVQAYSAIANADFGFFQLTTLTGYNVNRSHSTLDFSYVFGPIVQPVFGVTGAPYNLHGHVNKISQEVRLTGTIWQNFDWLVGLFYTHEKGPTLEEIDAADAVTGRPAGVDFTYAFPASFDEYAAFGDLTYHFTDNFDVQLGGRESFDRSTFGPATEGGAFFGPVPQTVPQQSAKDNAFTYLLTPRYKISSDLMVYARFASGYRPGGPNAAFTGFPPYSSPDKTEDYELGLKGDFFDHTLSIDASLFHIDWKRIQITAIDPKTAFQYVTNGNAASSEGFELSATVRPRDGLTISGWVDYDDAVLTKDFPATANVNGFAGNKLPIDPTYSGHLSVNQDFEISEEWRGYVGGDVSYVGRRLGSFTSAPQRQVFPSYTKVDLNMGLKFGTWTANLYVDNLADERGIVGGGQGYDPPDAFVYITPRTIGFNLIKTF
jgi:outer membrane receptor protein involved in Fe transport